MKYFLKGLNGAQGFLTNRAGVVQPLSQAEINGMLGKHEESKVELEPESTFAIGEEVKVLDGPFNGFFGTIEEIKDKKVKVSVLIFGRKTPVELGILQIDRKS